MMDWIKCTDRMPPDMEPVIVTVKFSIPQFGRKKGTFSDVRYNHGKGVWEYLSDSYHAVWDELKVEVTHWMPMPEPAED